MIWRRDVISSLSIQEVLDAFSYICTHIHDHRISRVQHCPIRGHYGYITFVWFDYEFTIKITKKYLNPWNMPTTDELIVHVHLSK